MNILPVVGYDAANKMHRPMLVDSEVIDPRHIPLSAFTGNEIRLNSDGLYAGRFSTAPVIRVNPTLGIDSVPADTAGTYTCKSLDHALDLIVNSKTKDATLLLLAGSAFTLTEEYVLRDINLTISFYDDPKYGVANTFYQTSKMLCQHQEDLSRPSINATVAQDVATNCWYMRNITFINSRVSIIGLKIDIPDAPFQGIQSAMYSQYSDMFRLKDSTLSLDGVIVNKLGAASNFGLVGVVSRSTGSVRAYATQLRVENVVLASTGNSVALSNRAFFFKLLPDLPALQQSNDRFSLVPTTLGSSASSALLDIHWTLNQSLADAVSGSSSVPTFPNSTSNYGLGNYIYGLVRDTQHRAVNVRSNLIL